MEKLKRGLRKAVFFVEFFEALCCSFCSMAIAIPRFDGAECVCIFLRDQGKMMSCGPNFLNTFENGLCRDEGRGVVEGEGGKEVVDLAQ